MNVKLNLKVLGIKKAFKRTRDLKEIPHKTEGSFDVDIKEVIIIPSTEVS